MNGFIVDAYQFINNDDEEEDNEEEEEEEEEEEVIFTDYDPIIKSSDCFEKIPKKKIKVMNFISKVNSKGYNQIKRDCKSYRIIINNKSKEELSKELAISMMKKKI